MSYRIKRVAHLTGINPATLRAWERRYGLVAPDRTGSGYRLYTDEDVAMLSRIKVLVDEGLTIGEAISRVRRGAEPLPADAGGPSVRDVRFRMLEALVSFDRRGALEAYQDVMRLPPERRVEEVLLPVLRQVGELWEANECGVGEEHFATAFIREKLAGIIEDLDTGAARGPEAVCAGVPGEQHECGLLARHHPPGHARLAGGVPGPRRAGGRAPPHPASAAPGDVLHLGGQHHERSPTSAR